MAIQTSFSYILQRWCGFFSQANMLAKRFLDTKNFVFEFSLGWRATQKNYFFDLQKYFLSFILRRRAGGCSLARVLRKRFVDTKKNFFECPHGVPFNKCFFTLNFFFVFCGLGLVFVSRRLCFENGFSRRTKIGVSLAWNLYPQSNQI